MASTNPEIASSSSTLRRTYDVFLSLCGSDTRNSFADHLYSALKQKGINVFGDDEKLERGKDISLGLPSAIQESECAVVIISENYAFSKRCLMELTEIVKCMREKQVKVLPVFHYVNPSDVRKQRKKFAEAFARHREDPEIEEEQRKKWRAALREMSNLAGWHVHDRSESEVIGDICRVVVGGFGQNSSNISEDMPSTESCLNFGFSFFLLYFLIFSFLIRGSFSMCWQNSQPFHEFRTPELTRRAYSSLTPPPMYDAFLGFCGKDSRNSFSDHLYVALKQSRIKVFRDDKNIDKGKYISEEIFKAIKSSKYAVIVISKNYGFSKWCLKELTMIMDCAKKRGLTVLPVFYHVHPADVRKLKGGFGEAFGKHLRDPEVPKMQLKLWKDALKKVADVKGWHVHANRSEAAIIEEICKKISSDLSNNLK